MTADSFDIDFSTGFFFAAVWGVLAAAFCFCAFAIFPLLFVE
jgi:hypothetical protein